MTRLVAPLAQWWDGRTVRERRMLTVMLMIAAAVLIWLALVRPAWSWREHAAYRRHRAAAEAQAVQVALGRLASTGTAARSAPIEGLEPLVRRAAGAAGLQATLAMDADGGLGFSVAQAGSREGFAWLAALESDHGVRICRLSVVENADATLVLEGSLSGGDCPVGT